MAKGMGMGMEMGMGIYILPDISSVERWICVSVCMHMSDSQSIAEMRLYDMPRCKLINSILTLWQQRHVALHSAPPHSLTGLIMNLCILIGF